MDLMLELLQADRRLLKESSGNKREEFLKKLIETQKLMKELMELAKEASADTSINLRAQEWYEGFYKKRSGNSIYILTTSISGIGDMIEKAEMFAKQKF